VKSYPTDRVRNILIVGHGGAGKTSLVEAVCHATGATNRLGRVEDGTTVTDFEPEETRKHISVSLAVAPVEHDWPSPPSSTTATRSTCWTPPATPTSSATCARPCRPPTRCCS
jgi:translation elongation factor EF-G